MKISLLFGEALRQGKRRFGLWVRPRTQYACSLRTERV